VSFNWSPFVFLLFTNSEKDGICGKLVLLNEQLSIGTIHGEVSDLALPEYSLLVSSAQGSKAGGDLKGCSAGERDCLASDTTLIEAEALIERSRFINSLELADFSHLTVLATCE